MMQSTEQATFPIAQSRAIVRDLFQPNPLIYWADFLITLTVAYGCAAVYFFSPLFSLQQIVFLVISGLALHRLANYIHEVAHLNAKRSLRAFQVAWNILAGIPMLMPSYFFETHIAHHNPNQFGTGADCEYVPLGRRPLRSIAMFMGQVLLQPLFVIIRFVLVTPISFLHPKLRQWVLENYSAFVFIWPCPRKISEDAPRAAWAAMDIACWLRATARRRTFTNRFSIRSIFPVTVFSPSCCTRSGCVITPCTTCFHRCRTTISASLTAA